MLVNGAAPLTVSISGCEAGVCGPAMGSAFLFEVVRVVHTHCLGNIDATAPTDVEVNKSNHINTNSMVVKPQVHTLSRLLVKRSSSCANVLLFRFAIRD